MEHYSIADKSLVKTSKTVTSGKREHTFVYIKINRAAVGARLTHLRILIG